MEARMGQFYKAAKAADVASGKLRSVEIEGRQIALFSVGEEIYALGDLHTHPMSNQPGGRLSSVMPPADQSSAETIERYNVRVHDGDVEIEIA